LFGVFVLIASLTSSLIFAVIAFLFDWNIFNGFCKLTSSILQINTDPKMRGRVMSFWSIAFFGSTAIRWADYWLDRQTFGAQWSLVVGGLAAIAGAIFGFIALKRKSHLSSLDL